ncbi:hypothetical protein CNBF2240 [Cryptococcus deneoformans B-3501A]|uniref:hypothetical protein n=1 Tax=Cryptococcus deneoformans (strain B-3501A) TaxID=283643 RepID=UPI000042FE7A|nr:hypothetical protein CNBF2240 [Cryptococcus neoformans var. neoformans B-3501A]EAL20147.1 hypothetical protein CNBF2240 [Cryptococcus neoformans var. neoformans B-3501A]
MTPSTLVALTPNSTQDEVTFVLNKVNDAFKTAQSDLQLNSSKRDFHYVLHARDLTDDVSKLLAAIVEDLNSLLSPIVGLLSQIPIVSPILEDINTALDAIVQGLDNILGGILDLVATILKDLGINITPLLSGLLQLLTGILGGS